MTTSLARATAAATFGLVGLLLQLGRGSCSSDVQQDPVEFSAEDIQARFARHRVHRHKAASRKSIGRFTVRGETVLNGNATIEGLGIHTKNLLAGKVDADKSNENGDGNTGSRQLQTSCTSGTSIGIVSSVYPLMEGCHSASTTDTSGGEAIYLGTTSLVAALRLTDDADASYFWVAGYISSTTSDFVPVCVGTELASAVHPADATWICDVDGDGELETPTSTQFSTACGCTDDVSPSPTPVTEKPVAPVAAPTAPSPTPSAGGTCADGDSFLVSSSVWPDIEGCYVETGALLEGELVYTMSGTASLGQILVFAYVPDTDPSLVLWALVFGPEAASSNEFFNHCYSNEPATTYHPADVISWWCDATESGSYSVASSTTFSADCGCTGTSPTPVTPTPTPKPVSAESTASPTAVQRGSTTPSPISIGSPMPPVGGTTPSPAGAGVDPTASCGESDQFTITASQASTIEGCYTAVEGTVSSGDGQVYSLSGTVDRGQTLMIPITDDDTGKTTWYLGFLGEDEGDTVVYCLSVEDAATSHPTDSTWICDLAGTSSNFEAVSALDFDIDCGCDDAPSPVGDTSPTTPDQPTSVNQPSVAGVSTSGNTPKGYVSFAVTACAGALAVVALVMTW